MCETSSNKQNNRLPSQDTVCDIHRKTYLWSIEDILHTEHRYNSQHFFTASEMNRHNQHLWRLWLQRKFSHLQQSHSSISLTAVQNYYTNNNNNNANQAQSEYKHLLTFCVRRYVAIAMKPMPRLQICPILHITIGHSLPFPQVTSRSLQ